MFGKLLSKVFGTSNDRIVSSMYSIVDNINSYEPNLKELSDDALRAKTEEFKSRLSNGETLDDILPEAFAVMREASRRVLGMRHFDVQLVGGIVMHRGMIAEMKTGEGKTLAATLPAYLNALTGKGVHVVTVNDYLAKRDSEWMGEIYRFLGLSVGCVINSLPEEERKAAYECDITHGTNNEFGFDYLRDNLKYDTARMVQKPFNFAIVDEVDSILVDEARTPLIISGPTSDNSDLYVKIDKIVPKLAADDYEVDEKTRSALLTDKGNESVEQILRANKLIQEDTGLYDLENMLIVHHVNQALKAHKLFAKDVDYIVKEGKVMIIDEFTGRIMDGRRYSEGLHQALEAKEGVAIQNENQTLASVTFQNYFRMYPKLAGMTGTAMTEAQEFNDIYKLDVITIPTNVPVQRIDEEDEIYLTADDKYNAIIKEIEKSHAKQQPVLVGTTSIEKSEHISAILKKNKIKHNVLNAKYHEQEAYIIAQAGRPGAVTIATNMAGRGTDIQLGGNVDMLLQERVGEKNLSDEQIAAMRKEIQAEVSRDKDIVHQAGGLYVLATERHESRRIDNQLRGRSGRQGDRGRTKFYLSMEDDLMRIFGSDKIKGLLSKLGLKDGESIVHSWITKSIEKAQQKVEARNYDIRKTLLRFDDVMNEQRKVVYEQRRYIMSTDEIMDLVTDLIEENSASVVGAHIAKDSLPEEWDAEALGRDIQHNFAIKFDMQQMLSDANVDQDLIISRVQEAAKAICAAKVERYTEETFKSAIRHILIITLDALWKDHLHMLDHLRTGIGLRAYAQKDPLNEYKVEAFNMFKNMMEEFATLSMQRISHLEIAHDVQDLQAARNTFETRRDPVMEQDNQKDEHGSILVKARPVMAVVSASERDPKDPTTWGKIARNEDCPCGSGKKYKHCHGAL